MTKRFDEYGPYGENNPPVGVRPLDAEERQRAKERDEANKAVKLDAFHEHEALHTVHLAMEFIDNNLSQHPYISQNKELSDRISNVVSELFNIYQDIGASRE